MRFLTIVAGFVAIDVDLYVFFRGFLMTVSRSTTDRRDIFQLRRSLTLSCREAPENDLS